MATKYFTGLGTATAQVSTGSIDSLDATPANNTFTVTIGGVAVSTTGDTDVATTATALRAALNASTHPYFSNITWSGTSGDIIGTADTAGVAFSAALTVTGIGSGTVTDFAATTSVAGPNVWSDGDNWSDGSAPANGDTAILRDSEVNICYGLSQSSVTLASLVIEATYTGRLGLDYSVFATSANGQTTVSTAGEYRSVYLDIGADRVEIGGHTGVGSPSGSARLIVRNAKSGTSDNEVISSASSSADLFRPPVRLLAAHASAAFRVRGGNVGIAADKPAETATVGNIDVASQASGAVLTLGAGVTNSGNITIGAGTCTVRSASTVASVSVTGGDVTIEGDYTITTLDVNGGTVKDNHKTGVTTCNLRGGTLDWQRTDEARTYTTLNHTGGTLLDNPTVTVTTLNRGRARVSF